MEKFFKDSHVEKVLETKCWLWALPNGSTWISRMVKDLEGLFCHLSITS